MNDPNGLAFHDGRFHAFYQHQPDGPRWGRMHWGHATSRDLVSWEHLPIALSPDDGGPDADGCWSGCLVEDGGTPTILYTGVRQEGRLRRASICLATSRDDLRTWQKAPGGPVIVGAPAGIRPDAFRDPFVWRDGDGWAMALGAGTTRYRGAVLLYRSRDLRTWRFEGPLLTTEAAVTADPALVVDEIDSPCWECPQLVRLDGADVLVVSIVDRAPRVRPAHVVAFVGELTGNRFHVHHTERVGLGPDLYAPAVVVAPDGRRLLFGWIPEDPPARGSRRTWAGALTFPRVLSIDPDGHLRIDLAAEVDRFDGPAVRLAGATIRDGAPWTREFHEGWLELRLSMLPRGAASIRLDVLGSDGPVAEVRYETQHRRLAVYRIGVVRVAGREAHRATTLPPDPDGRLRLRLILDGSVMELVANDRVTATARLPRAAAGPRTISCSAIGGAFHLDDVEASGPGAGIVVPGVS